LAGGLALVFLAGLLFGAGAFALTVFAGAFLAGLDVRFAAADRTGLAGLGGDFFVGRATRLLCTLVLERASALAGGPAGCSRVASALSSVKRLMDTGTQHDQDVFPQVTGYETWRRTPAQRR
jgi:hypothetical protein